MKFYRLEDKSNELPTHWAYCDAFELIDGAIIDNRVAGFQVWGELPSVICAAAGVGSSDGQYTIEDGYKYLLIIEASDYGDGAGEWFAIDCQDVESVKAVSLAALLEWAIAQWEKDVIVYDYYQDDFVEWCQDSEEEIQSWLEINAQNITKINFVNTLINPYDTQRICA